MVLSINKKAMYLKVGIVAVILGGVFGISPSSASSDMAQVFTRPAIAYQPRGFSPGSEYAPSARAQITQELKLLHELGFQSLVSYGSRSAMGSIPEIARAQGFSGMVIMGIWDIHSDEEWANAVAQRDFVDGYCLGNEGLFALRYTVKELEARMIELRRATGKPVTTGEPIYSYLEGPYREWLLEHSDWLFPNTHPFWGGQRDFQQAVDWVVARIDYLEASSGKNVIIKETGLPSIPPQSHSEEVQKAFFTALKSTGIRFVYFEAFDQPWKHSLKNQPEAEAHWGLHDAEGLPKKIIESFTMREFP